MSGTKWEDFLTGKGEGSDDDDENDGSPMATLKLPGSKTIDSSQPSRAAPVADSKPKVETLEEKIARVMAGINMPKLDTQKSLPSMGAGKKTLSDRSISSEPPQPTTSSQSASSAHDAQDSGSVGSASKGKAKIVRPESVNSLSSFSIADGQGASNIDREKVNQRENETKNTSVSKFESPPPNASVAVIDSDSETSSVRKGSARIVKPESAQPNISSVPIVESPLITSQAAATASVSAEVMSNEHGDTPQNEVAARHTAPNNVENSPIAQVSVSYNPEVNSSPTSEITDADSQHERTRSRPESRGEATTRGSSRDSVRSSNAVPKTDPVPTPAPSPAQVPVHTARVVAKPFSVTPAPAPVRPKSAPRPPTSAAKNPAPPAFTPQQRRIPDKSSALTAMGLTTGHGGLATPDTSRRRPASRGGEPWSVTKRAQLDSSYAASTPGRALIIPNKTQQIEPEHSVSVAVRIRPFTIGEIQTGPRRIVSVNGDKLILVNPNAFDADPDTIAAAAAAVSLENMRCNDWAKVFCFDNCFWSYDPNDEGDTYVDQDGVFDTMGRNMAEDVVNGISTCCFAYGHTSTGKTHTMFGGDEIAQTGTFIESESLAGPVLLPDAGLIPRVFLDIVQRVFSDEAIANDTRITLSFMEIYQEKIRDCLAMNGAASDLKVREHPALGPYVENLTRVEVESATDVLELLYRGYEERSTASTLKNRHSSRSHAIATLELTPIGAADPFSPSSKPARTTVGSSSIPGTTVVHRQEHVRAQMVDLAGSEKESTKDGAGDFETSSHRSVAGGPEGNVEKLELKMIRRSLSTLGYIIKALGQGNSAKGLPFRDSVLTWLLKDALSGHCNVTMLATISPSHTCFDETLHTLKYADRLCRLSVSSLPGKESSGRVGINDTVDPDLTYSLATEYSKLKQELGANKPGSHAARQLLQQTISDPQQRLARLDPYKSTHVGDTTHHSMTPARTTRPSSASTTRTGPRGNERHDFYSSGGASELIDQDLKEAYRQLHGKYVELQIELENARTDRDGMQLELQNMQDALSRAESERFMGSKSAMSDMTIALRSAEEEVSELRGVVMRKEETADRLLSELADERQARATVEKTARAQVTELIGRLEALHKQGQATAKESQKWQQEASIIQQEKEMVENQLRSLKEDLLDSQEASENRISQLEDELRLSMDHVTHAIKERDRTNAEITSVLREKADMAAREVLLTQRIQELQMEVEKANNESKVKSELEIVKLQRDSLFEIIKQQEQALHMQQQQSEASLKMLHQRQAALDRYEQRSEGEHDELSDLQRNLQNLLANEGQTLYSELIDAKKLIAVIASVREKVLESGLLKEDISRLESERDAQRTRIERMEKETSAWRAEKGEVIDQLEHFKKHAIDWETRAQYWQQVAKKTSTHSSSLHEAHDPVLSGFASSTITKSAEYLDLRSENVTLQERLSKTQHELEEKKKELAMAKGDMEKEFAQLWTSVEQLNKLDASKDKTIAELKAERDAAVKEKNDILKKYREMQQEYEGLQSELQSIDLNLLDVADHEGIEVEDILHVVHDNHPHVPHNLSDGYFAKRARSRSPTNVTSGRRQTDRQPDHFPDTTASYSYQYRHPSMNDSDAVSEPGYYRSTGSSRGRSTSGPVGRRAEQRQQSSATSPHYRRGVPGSSMSLSGERTPSSSLRRSLQEHSSNDEKGLEMQIEELSQFLTNDPSRHHKQNSRSRQRISTSSNSRY